MPRFGPTKKGTEWAVIRVDPNGERLQIAGKGNEADALRLANGLMRKTPGTVYEVAFKEFEYNDFFF